MAEVISFREGARSIRRRRAEDETQRCLELVELNLRFAVEIYAVAPAHEKSVRARHVRVLAEMLEAMAEL